MNNLENINLDSIPITPSLENIAPIEPEPSSRSKKILTRAAWVGFGIFSLLFFTMIKLPDDRLKGFIEGNIAMVLGQKGITFTSTESKLSYLFGVSYSMKNVTLNLPSTSVPIRIDKIEVSPSLLSSALGRYSGGFSVRNGEGSLSGSFSMRGQNFSFSFKSKKLDLGKLGLLPIAAGIQGGAVLDGNGSISGDPNSPATLDGSININLSKVVIEPQTIAGFSVPKLNISEGIAEVSIDKAKATLKTLRLGKTGNPSDDLQGTITGDFALGKTWESSTMNLKAHFSLSEGIMKAFILLDAILGGGKQPDGSYSFNLIGPIESPMPTPVPPGGG